MKWIWMRNARRFVRLICRGFIYNKFVYEKKNYIQKCFWLRDSLAFYFIFTAITLMYRVSADIVQPDWHFYETLLYCYL